ncbi:MAG: hypothetical protein IPL93_08310 [Actinomycetales bacterium]|nr:hypothetical protein [Actinomycetales bacterium]
MSGDGPARVVVVCDDPGAYHEHRGTSVLRTFARDLMGGEHWEEVELTTPRHARRRAEALARGEIPPTAPPGSPRGLGVRPAATVVLRGDDVDEPATSATLRGDLEAEGRRRKYALRCGCGLARSVRAEDAWPLFDQLAAAGVGSLSLRGLIGLLDDPRVSS